MDDEGKIQGKDYFKRRKCDVILNSRTRFTAALRMRSSILIYLKDLPGRTVLYINAKCCLSQGWLK